MDTKELEGHLNALGTAQKIGLVQMYFNRSVQVTNKLLIELADGNYSFETRFSAEYPFEVSTKINGTKYFTICGREELENTFGGNTDELITAN